MPEPARGIVLAVTGPRDYDNTKLIYWRLDQFREAYGIKLLVHGACPTGLDHWAGMWAGLRGVPQKPYQANWVDNGNRAGPIRNGVMLRDAKPDYLLAFKGYLPEFPKGSGTQDCITQAKGLGIKGGLVPDRFMC